MYISAYEEAIFCRDRAANENTRPPRPNAIKQAEKALGLDNYEIEHNGRRRVLVMGRWTRPLCTDDFILEANRKLKSEGKPQITGDPRWGA